MSNWCFSNTEMSEVIKTNMLTMDLMFLHDEEPTCPDYFMLVRLPCHPWTALFKEPGLMILRDTLTYLQLQRPGWAAEKLRGQECKQVWKWSITLCQQASNGWWHIVATRNLRKREQESSFKIPYMQVYKFNQAS